MLQTYQAHSVAISSICTIKLECFDKIRTCGNCDFKNEFFKEAFQFLKKELFY